jgi:hypothetical protein
VRLEILTYAPTEFYHCQHCEVVWQDLGMGQRIRAEQRRAALPPDLQQEYAAIADWVSGAYARYGNALEVSVVDVASLEGVFKSVRHRLRRFPAFVFDGMDRVQGFDPLRLDEMLERKLRKEAITTA